MSRGEAEAYFTGDTQRVCKPATSALSAGALTNIDVCCCWWLRSPGDNNRNAAYISDSNDLHAYGQYAEVAYAVRPALWIQL